MRRSWRYSVMSNHINITNNKNVYFLCKVSFFGLLIEERLQMKINTKTQWNFKKINWNCQLRTYATQNSYVCMTSDAYYRKLGQRNICSTCSVFYWFFYVVRRYSFPSPNWSYDLDIFTLYNMWSAWRPIQLKLKWHAAILFNSQSLR